MTAAARVAILVIFWLLAWGEVGVANVASGAPAVTMTARTKYAGLMSVR